MARAHPDSESRESDILMLRSSGPHLQTKLQPMESDSVPISRGKRGVDEVMASQGSCGKRRLAEQVARSEKQGRCAGLS